MNETIRMQLSAFVDGELPESETELLLRRISQDVALRAEVAEFIEIGRAIRGEQTVVGIHALRARISTAIDEDAVPMPEPEESAPRQRLAKPLGGIAIAAAVAVVAIVGLQQTSTVDGDAAVAGSGADAAAATEYVVPPDDPELREFMRMHGELSSEQGANGMNVRDVTFRMRGSEGTLEELAADEEPPTDTDAPDPDETIE
jgi:hypothetical protein